VQENGRFALDYLQRDIRMIGHFGCVNDQSHKLQTGAMALATGAAERSGLPLDFSLSVQGFEANGTAPQSDVNLGGASGGWTPALPAHLAGLGIQPGTDVIMLRFLRGNGAPVTNIATGASTTTFTVATGTWNDLTDEGVANPTVFGVADCSFVNVFTGAGNSGASTVTAGSLIDRYTPNPAGHAAVYRAEAVAYYIANGAGGRPSLWRARWSTNANNPAIREELVEGIESLQLLYGQDRSVDVTEPSGFVGNQVPASTIGVATSTAGEQAWRRVGLVQIGIVAASAEPASSVEVLAANRPEALGVRFTAPNDQRIRTTYESTVALRNRLFGN
jgi:type IV pilus assembly protein PilW